MNTKLKSGSVFTNNSHEHVLSFSSEFCTFDFITTSDWLNVWFSQSGVALQTNTAKYRKIWRTRL